MSSLSSYLGHLLKQYFLIVWYILNTVLNGRLPWWLRWLKKKKICLQCERLGFNPWVGKIHWGRHGNPLQYSCLENPHGQRSLAGYSPWGRKKSDITEWPNTAYWMVETQRKDNCYLKTVQGGGKFGGKGIMIYNM